MYVYAYRGFESLSLRPARDQSWLVAGLRGAPVRICGEVTEWLKVQHWKCCVRLARTEGSNPSLSANTCIPDGRGNRLSYSATGQLEVRPSPAQR